ncbi:MAG: phosphatidate cytidylyltransferase, partial [Butyricicoccaceae bacterium]
MKQRVIFGVIGGIAVLLAIFVLPPMVAQVALVLLSAIAAYEFSAAVTGKKRLIQLVSIAFAVVMAVVSARWSYDPVWTRLAILAGVILFFAILLRFRRMYQFTEVAACMFASMVIPYLMMSLVRILTSTNGRFWVLLPLLAAWGSDTCALFTGMKFGRHKLAPVISPKKTWEGSIGGLLGAVVLVLVYGLVLKMTVKIEISILLCILVGVFGSIAGQLGDLSFSIVKRQSGIKDYGNIFPGHGGVLDRF